MDIARLANVMAIMHLSMLSPTPSTWWGGALLRDLIQNFAPRMAHLN